MSLTGPDVIPAGVNCWLEHPDGKSESLRLWADVNGDKLLGTIDQGINGEWFFVPVSRQSWACPLQGLDNKKGTGHRTPREAAQAWQASITQVA